MNSRSATTAPEHMLLEPDVPELLEKSSSSRGSRKAPDKTEWRQTLGLALVLIGPVLIFLGWYGLSGTNRTAQQLSYFLSGGIGGAAVLASGIALLISYEHVSDRAAMGTLVERLDRLEFGVASEFDALRADLRLGRNGPAGGIG